MVKRHIPLAICYDFDGTLAPGNMQERDFIPNIGMKTKGFWEEVKDKARQHNGDNILMYMKLMLDKARQAEVSVRKEDIAAYGRSLEFYPGVEEWFGNIDEYGRLSGVKVSHHVISSGIREMIEGSCIAKNFQNVYASSFCYDHHGIADWPALALNYTTKTQYLFRINKGTNNVYDHSAINQYVDPADRPVPFSNMVSIGDGETDIPCFRLVKDQGGHSIAVYQPGKKGAKAGADQLRADGRVNFVAPTDYTESSKVDRIIKGIIDNLASVENLHSLSKSS